MSDRPGFILRAKKVEGKTFIDRGRFLLIRTGNNKKGPALHR